MAADMQDIITVCEAYARLDSQQQDLVDGLLDDAGDTYVDERNRTALLDVVIKLRRAGLHNAADELHGAIASAQGPGARR